MLACELWPGHTTEEMMRDYADLLNDHEAAVFLYHKQGEAIGFSQCQLRHDYVEGTETSPVGYLEGIYIREIMISFLNATDWMFWGKLSGKLY